jgi:hypothetical protein
MEKINQKLKHKMTSELEQKHLMNIYKNLSTNNFLQPEAFRWSVMLTSLCVFCTYLVFCIDMSMY